ncbi:hypothetical protein PBI_SCTP2_413 [Salicola phage SCTP-2]|nr:hypothetical protein PBI_SCTP2_413 [Salicola phage SCTP-2]
MKKIICFLIGHKLKVDKIVRSKDSKPIVYKSCERCSFDNYRDR